MYLFVCLNHFYCEKKKKKQWVRCFFIVVLRTKSSAISSYISFGSQVNLYEEQLFIPSNVRIIKLTAVNS